MVNPKEMLRHKIGFFHRNGKERSEKNIRVKQEEITLFHSYLYKFTVEKVEWFLSNHVWRAFYINYYKSLEERVKTS